MGAGVNQVSTFIASSVSIVGIKEFVAFSLLARPCNINKGLVRWKNINSGVQYKGLIIQLLTLYPFQQQEYIDFKSQSLNIV